MSAAVGTAWDAEISAAFDGLAPEVARGQRDEFSGKESTETEDSEAMGAAAVAHLLVLRRCRSTRTPDSDRLQTSTDFRCYGLALLLPLHEKIPWNQGTSTNGGE